MQYSITFCNRLEAASDVTSDAVYTHVGVDVRIKFGDSRSKLS